jgi:putative oxidoreductase
MPNIISMGQNNSPAAVNTIPCYRDFAELWCVLGIQQLVSFMVVTVYIILKFSYIQTQREMTNSRKSKTIILRTVNDNRDFLVRLIVGLIFLSEGIQKYVFPELLGTGRFEKIGFTDPSFWAYFTGTFEIICGIFVLLGFLTRLASIPLMIIMMTAFVTTKWPMLAEKGFWSFAHEYRTDFAMTLLLVWLIVNGAGRWSADAGIIKTGGIKEVNIGRKSQ